MIPIHEQEPPDPILVQILGDAYQRDGSYGGLGDNGADLEPVNLVLGAAGAAGEVNGGGGGGEAPEEESGAGDDEAER